MAQTQELSGNRNPQYFSKSTAVQMGAYCGTQGRLTARIEGALQYFVDKQNIAHWATDF